MIIGVTGKSGSGKNYFSTQLVRIQPNLIHIDIDLFGHSVLTEDDVKYQLRQTFGNDIFSGESVNRKALGDVVFNNRNNHSKLIDITWGRMQSILDKQISDSSRDYLLNWILLPHTKYFGMCDIKYLVTRDDDSRFDSIFKRDNISMDTLLLREKNSIEYNDDDYDFIIRNTR